MTNNKSIIYDKFLGRNNIWSETSLGMRWLTIAANVDIDDSSKIRRRRGREKKYSGDVHSLWSNGAICLFREGTALKRFWTDYTTSTLRNDMTDEKIQMAYSSVGGRIYYADGADKGIIERGDSRTWGLDVPLWNLSLTSPLGLTSGGLLAGRYQVCLTYERNDKQESGASIALFIDIPTDGGGISMSLPTSSDPTVVYINIYLTHKNGDVFYRAIRIPNGTPSAVYNGQTTEFVLALKTQDMYSPPAGSLLAFYNGRMFVIDNEVAWYSIPNALELFALATDYLKFSDPVTLFAPVATGIWASTTKSIMFLSGQEPPFNIIEKADYGSPINPIMYVPGQIFRMEGNIITWRSHRGICIGGNEGEFVNLTEDRYNVTEDVKRSELMYRNEDGITQLIAVARW